MLGSLGLFGNGLIQLAASIALAESQGLALVVPQRWHARFGRVFVGGGGAGGDAGDALDADNNPTPYYYRWRPIPDTEAWALPIVSDRVVLSHPGFKVWMATREPYLSLAVENGGGGGALSGRQLRRLFPQAAVADVSGDARAEGAPPPAPLAGQGLWGWFQWPTASLARHAPLLLGRDGGGVEGPLRLRPELARALDAAVDALVGCYCSTRRPPKLVAVHLRRGDCAGRVCPEKGHSTTAVGAGGGGGEDEAPQAPAPPPLRTEPPFELGTGEAWDDQGLCWTTPLEWLRPGLERALAEVDGGDEQGNNDNSTPPLVVVCTDDPHLARDPSAVWPGAATLAAAAADHEALAAAVEATREALKRARGSGGNEGDDDDDDDDDLPMLLDWRLMQRADALLISNSTFSFTAAWLSVLPPPPPPPSSGGAPDPPHHSHHRLFFRPCPQACGFVRFDPWDSLPLLPSRVNLPGNHGAHWLREKLG